MYWCLSVDLTCKSIFILPCLSLTLTSRNVIFSSLESLVNFQLGWNLLRSSKNNFNLSWPCAQMQKISSVYLTHQNFLFLCFSKNSVSTLSMKIQAYVGAYLVPISVPEICCLIWLLNLKKKFFLNKLCHLYEVLCRNSFPLSFV